MRAHERGSLLQLVVDDVAIVKPAALEKEQHRGSPQSAATLESLARPPLIHNLASALASIMSAAAEYFDRVEGPGTKGT